MLEKIKNWYKLAETKRSLIFLHILLTSLRVATWIVSPIFAAKVTVALVEGNYQFAITNLAIELGIILLGFLCWDLVYRNAGGIFRDTYIKVQNKIYRKAYRAKSSNFKITSKEKLLNIIGTDIDVISNFGDTLGVRIGRVIQVVVTLVIVFISNWLVGMAILGVSLLNFFILKILNRKIANEKQKLYEDKDKIYEKFSQVLSNQDIIKEYDMGPSYADEYFTRCKKYAKSISRHKNISSIKDNYFIGLYKTLIFLITVFLIFLVKNSTISLTVYFILVPYLLTSVELINEIINITASIEETDVSTKRINTVLNFTDEEFVKYGDIKRFAQGSNLAVMDVSYKNNNEDSPYFGEISNVDMTFRNGTINLIKGQRYCGKRVLFNLISRKIKPQSGAILLNEINIYDYDKATYKMEIFNAFSKPKFLDDSILNNFYAVEKNKEQILEVCNIVGISNIINSLPDGINTNIIDAHLSIKNMFLFGIAMAILKKSAFLCIYEIPQGLSKKEEQEIKKIIVNLCSLRTILLFTHSNLFDDVASTIYLMENGKSTQLQSEKKKSATM